MRANRALAVREAIETELAGSFALALSPRPCTQRTLLPFQVDALDTLTGGGAPAGAVTELVGLGSTGKTSAAMRLAAGAMRAGKVCAWVDASDSFDPHTGAANGMPLPQLLWVRCGAAASGQSAPGSAAWSSLSSVEGSMETIESKGRHPRDEERGMERAVGRLFASAPAGLDASEPSAAVREHGCSPDRNGTDAADWPDGSRIGMHSTRNRQTLGTPGAPNAPLSPFKRAPHTPRPAFRPVPRSEQAADDRLVGRRAQSASVGIPAVCDRASATLTQMQPQTQPQTKSGTRPWTRLDQALRAADLLLQGGGFAVVVLDLSGIAPEHALRIPMATWFRFRALAEASGTAFVLVSEAPCARSSAGLVLQFKPLRLALKGGTVVEAARYEAEVTRQRFQTVPRKQPQATWAASAYAGVLDAGSQRKEPARKPVPAWPNVQAKPHAQAR